MSDIVLWLAALLLSLFCLIYSIAARRDLYLPLPNGFLPKLRNQHSVFLAMLGALAVNHDAGLWALYAIAGLYALVGVAFLARSWNRFSWPADCEKVTNCLKRYS